MSDLVLVTYATHYGSTQEVAVAIAVTLRKYGLAVDIQPIPEVRTLGKYSTIILGAPLFMFRWHKDAHRFLTQYREALKEQQVIIFALGPTHEPHDKEEWQSSRTQLNKELAKYPWLIPIAVEIFGGKYDPTKLHFPIKLLAGKVPTTDIRDWSAINTWASSLIKKLKPILPK